mgnify:CR=1 FL=1
MLREITPGGGGSIMSKVFKKWPGAYQGVPIFILLMFSCIKCKLNVLFNVWFCWNRFVDPGGGVITAG